MTGGDGGPGERPPQVLRVVSWNVHGWRDDPDAVQRVLRGLRPDVVCLQEVYRGQGPWPWGRGTRRGLRRVARACDLEFASGGWPAGGNAVLVAPRSRVERAGAVRIPTPRFGPRRPLPVPGPVARALPGRPARVRVPGLRVGERRGVALARIRVPAGPAAVAGRLVVAAVHLDLDATERVGQARTITALARRLVVGDAGVLVAGDLNELPGGPAWQVLGDLVADPAPRAGPTYSAVDPHQRIDAVLVSAGVQVVRYGEGTGEVDPDDLRRASDHRPVVVDLVVPAGAGVRVPG